MLNYYDAFHHFATHIVKDTGYVKLGDFKELLIDAAGAKNVEIGRILLEHGADPTLKFHQWPVSEEFLRAVRGSDATEER